MTSSLLNRIRLNLKGRCRPGVRHELYPQDEAIIEEVARELDALRGRCEKLERTLTGDHPE